MTAMRPAPRPSGSCGTAKESAAASVRSTRDGAPEKKMPARVPAAPQGAGGGSWGIAGVPGGPRAEPSPTTANGAVAAQLSRPRRAPRYSPSGRPERAVTLPVFQEPRRA